MGEVQILLDKGNSFDVVANTTFLLKQRDIKIFLTQKRICFIIFLYTNFSDSRRKLTNLNLYYTQISHLR